MILTLSVVLTSINLTESLRAQPALPQSQSASAQVPPREDVVSQREEEKPRKDEPIKWETSVTQETFALKETAMCSFHFTGQGGKQGVLSFCGEKMTYTGDLEMDESARLFFEHVVKRIVLCQSPTEEKREE